MWAAIKFVLRAAVTLWFEAIGLPIGAIAWCHLFGLVDTVDGVFTVAFCTSIVTALITALRLRVWEAE